MSAHVGDELQELQRAHQELHGEIITRGTKNGEHKQCIRRAGQLARHFDVQLWPLHCSAPFDSDEGDV
jgi:hypothetical protein